MTKISMLSMTFKVFRFFLLAVILVIFISCVSDKEEININIPNSTLNIYTRSGDNTADTKISYPIYIYVLDSDVLCVERTVITSDAQPISFLLQEGTYNVYALAGAEEGIYELPTLILLSPHETTGLNYNINVDGELEVVVSATLTTCGVDGISGWILPDEDETRSICSTYVAISNKFIAAGITPLATSGNYYYRKTNGAIGAFNPVTQV